MACVSVVERAFHNDDILSMGSLFEHLGYKHIYRSVSIGAFRLDEHELVRGGLRF